MYEQILKNEEEKMKKIFSVAILLAGINLNAYDSGIELIPSLEQRPIVKPPIETDRPPIRPKPIVRPTILYGKHYHTYVNTIESNCDEYIEIIKEKDAKIEALLKENTRLKEEAQTNLQERLKKEYDKEMKKFEERRK
jgi:hypothetical protein